MGLEHLLIKTILISSSAAMKMGFVCVCMCIKDNSKNSVRVQRLNLFYFQNCCKLFQKTSVL